MVDAFTKAVVEQQNNIANKTYGLDFANLAVDQKNIVTIKLLILVAQILLTQKENNNNG